MSQPAILRDIPEFRVEVPPSSSIASALAFAQQHLTQGVFNHVARTAYWALILAAKVPPFADSTLDKESLVLICILHDMGLSFETPQELEGLTTDKRFEIDGANIARDFIRSHVDRDLWDDAKIERLWFAIALHTTPSIGRHAAPEIALAGMAVEADFAGPFWSPSPGRATEAWITVDEYRAVTALFPRVDFNRNGVKKLMCGLCQRKPDTTYDNFVGLFGVKYGVDGEGGGRIEYARHWEENQAYLHLLGGLDALETLDSSS